MGIGKFQPPPHKIDIPKPIDKKFGTVDYVGEGTHYTKFGTNPSTGGFWANGWNVTKIIFYLFIYTFFSQTRLQVRTVDGFSYAIAQKLKRREITQECAFWGNKS